MMQIKCIVSFDRTNSTAPEIQYNKLCHFNNKAKLKLDRKGINEKENKKKYAKG